MRLIDFEPGRAGTRAGNASEFGKPADLLSCRMQDCVAKKDHPKSLPGHNYHPCRAIQRSLPHSRGRARTPLLGLLCSELGSSSLATLALSEADERLFRLLQSD
jgi:hypothetical protein